MAALDPEAIDAMRKRAVHLFRLGRPEASVRVVRGLVALGAVHPVDALLLTRAYREMGEVTAAGVCAKHFRTMMLAYGQDEIAEDFDLCLARVGSA